MCANHMFAGLSDGELLMDMPRASVWSMLLSVGIVLVGVASLGAVRAVMPARYSGGLADGISALQVGDYGTARIVFEKLANGNDPAGEMWLAHLYEDGLGVQPDVPKAVTLLTKAADAGSAAAATQLGGLYLDGNGVLQDLDAAQTWFSRAAHQGDAAAQRELGLLYARGLGAPKDPRKAYIWLDIATRNGDALARMWRDRVLASLTPEDLTQATAEAANTLRTLTADAQADHAPAKSGGKTEAQATAASAHS
jgi:TPR repeat protein